MLNPTGGCAGGAAGAANQPPLWLGLVAAGILGLGWLALHQVAAGYPANRRPGWRRLGNTLQLLTIPCTIGALVARSQLRTDECGHTIGSAGAWEDWLFIAALAAVMVAVVMAHPGSGWIAPAAVVVGDAGTLMVVLGQHPAALRTEAAMLPAVHGICTAMATWWARQLRSSPPPLRAKAADASRVLAGSWLILLLLLITAGRRIDQLLPESASSRCSPPPASAWFSEPATPATSKPATTPPGSHRNPTESPSRYGESRTLPTALPPGPCATTNTSVRRIEQRAAISLRSAMAWSWWPAALSVREHHEESRKPATRRWPRAWRRITERKGSSGELPRIHEEAPGLKSDRERSAANDAVRVVPKLPYGDPLFLLLFKVAGFDSGLYSLKPTAERFVARLDVCFIAVVVEDPEALHLA